MRIASDKLLFAESYKMTQKVSRINSDWSCLYQCPKQETMFLDGAIKLVGKGLVEYLSLNYLYKNDSD